MGIFKACDIRGRYGSELLAEHAYQLGIAIPEMAGRGRILVGGDARLSTPVLREKLIAGLLAQGCRVLDLGTLPTPAFYFARRFLRVQPGVMITASHNPADYNGFKVVLGEMPIREQDIEQLRGLMALVRGGPSGSAAEASQVDILPRYKESLIEQAPRLEGMHVVVDCSNGMAGLVAREVWAATGASVEFINSEVDGAFPAHLPNPANADNLRQLSRHVIGARADIGIAYDGDGDRVGVVDNDGSPASPDKVIAMLAAAALQASGPAPVMYDQKCSRLVPETIARYGGTAITEKSGHTFIKAAFIERQACYAGELSGHHFFKEIQGDDGIYASLVFCNIVKRSGRRLSSLLAELPSYPITPDLRIPLAPAAIESVLARLEEHFNGRGLVSTADGVRVELPEGWGMARKSVTEPVITLRFEGVDERSLRGLMTSFVEAAPELRGRLPIQEETGTNAY